MVNCGKEHALKRFNKKTGSEKEWI